MSQYPRQCWSLVNFNLKHSANVLHKMYVGSANYEFGKCECRLRGEDACRAYWVTALYCLYLPMLLYFFLLLSFSREGTDQHPSSTAPQTSPAYASDRTEGKGKGERKSGLSPGHVAPNQMGHRLDLPVCPRWLSLQACGAF